MRSEAEIRAIKRTVAEAGMPLEAAGEDVLWIKAFCGALAWALEEPVGDMPEIEALLNYGQRHERN